MSESNMSFISRQLHNQIHQLGIAILPGMFSNNKKVKSIIPNMALPTEIKRYSKNEWAVKVSTIDELQPLKIWKLNDNYYSDDRYFAKCSSGNRWSLFGKEYASVLTRTQFRQALIDTRCPIQLMYWASENYTDKEND